MGNRKSWKIRVKSIAGIETIIVAGVTSIASVASIASICPGLTVPPGLEGWVERSEGKLRWFNCSVLIISSLGVGAAVSTVDSVGKPPSSREVGEVLLLLLEEEEVVVVVVVRRDWRERNLGVRLGLAPGRSETNTEQDQKLHSDYLV